MNAQRHPPVLSLVSLAPGSRFAIAVLAALLAVCSTAVFTAPGQEPARGPRSVRGTAVDDSSAVLPGVTVVATGLEGRFLATEVTDAEGKYQFGSLPDGPVSLTFQLEGFASTVVRLGAALESEVIGRLKLAPLAETVVVHGRVPAPPPPPPPAPLLLPVPAHDQESVCGPAKATPPFESLGTIRSHRNDAEPGLYISGDELVIDGGTLNGLEVGRNLVVRRHYRVNSAMGPAMGEHTSGLLQIVTASDRASTAVVVYACDEMMKGDFLASFVPEPLRSVDPAGIPVYEEAARILFADAGQMLGVPRRLMVIDQGSTDGIRAAQRLTLFRRPRRNGSPPSVVGEAVVVAVRTDSATIRVENVTDAISFGDLAAPQRQPQATLLAAPSIDISRQPTP